MADFWSCIEFISSLWFHRDILSSESSAKPVPENLIQSSEGITESMIYSSSTDLSLPTPPDDEISPATSPPPEDEWTSSSDSPPLSLLDDDKKLGDNNEVERRERPTRLNLTTGRARFHSSSPLAEKSPKRIRYSAPIMGRLQRSLSCRRLEDLELEEVKGFMDLGFVFKKEHLSPRMMSVVPGLQRLGLSKKPANNASLIDSGSVAEGGDKLRAEANEERPVARPYLSEAWLIKRPDSPLLNLRLAKVSADSDMKEHLRFWARTVAAVIHQES